MEEKLKALYKKTFGHDASAIEPLKCDGSSRKYFRIRGEGRTAIGTFGPDPKENRAFLSFSRQFREKGLPVPEIYADDAADNIYLEEDLGDMTLFRYLTEQRAGGKFTEELRQTYFRAARELARFQVEGGKGLDYSNCHPRDSFDMQSMKWDLNYFKYYFLRLADIPFSEQALEDDFNKFAAYLNEAGQEHFLYRDFQSRNIMVKPDGSLWFIDYQGGRRGALQYDIASLLCDAKADLPFDVREAVLEEYLGALSRMLPVDREKFMAQYHAFVLIRIMQALGAYGLRGFYERKTHFLQSIPFAVRNMEYHTARAVLPIELPALSGVWRKIVASSKLRQFGQAKMRLCVRISSFSYRAGTPADKRGHGGGFVFDCRHLPNPGRYPEYAALTGRDIPVIDFLKKEPQVAEFLSLAEKMVSNAVENYMSRNFTDLMVSFGCTGGRHRSVYCAEKLAETLRAKYPVDVELTHSTFEHAAIKA